MDWGHISLHGFSPSVVVNNFNVIGVPVFPVEADSPLVVNTDTPLAFSFASELLKPVRRRDAEEFQGCCSMELRQFPKANPLNVRRQPGRKRTLKYFLCILGPERLYHAPILTSGVTIVKCLDVGVASYNFILFSDVVGGKSLFLTDQLVTTPEGNFSTDGTSLPVL
jgi:hypothetical protein